jgi:hypothetical protein
VGVVQTIPSLALLVFMIPLFGIGTLPACVALFLYSLLPIVRNTVAGLADIPPALRESAEALGLSPGAILRLVELPLASRSILAGIKSAAVIDVGTATLGALIGAGGLGQPIFTGIRLNDFSLLLEGGHPRVGAGAGGAGVVRAGGAGWWCRRGCGWRRSDLRSYAGASCDQSQVAPKPTPSRRMSEGESPDIEESAPSSGPRSLGASAQKSAASWRACSRPGPTSNMPPK